MILWKLIYLILSRPVFNHFYLLAKDKVIPYLQLQPTILPKYSKPSV